MPSLIFLIPVLSSTMVPVARTVVVILETFLLEIDLFVLEEKTLLLLARDADKDMDKTEEDILMMCYQFYLRCCALCVITVRKFFCARSKKKGEIDVTLCLEKGKKKGENAEILFSLGQEEIFFSFSQNKKKTKKNEKRDKRGENRGGKEIIFKKNPIYFITDYNAHHHHHHLFFLSLSLPTKYILF